MTLRTISNSRLVDGAKLDNLPAVVGDMTKAVYDPAGGNKQVAFADIVLKLDQTTPQTISGGQPVQDTLTASEMVSTDANKKFQSLPVATYPSLAELAYVKGVTSGIQSQLNAKGTGNGDMLKATYDPTNKNQDIFAYADGLVAGLLDFRGGYNASVNTFPASGGSGTAGAILKGDTWAISVAGTLGGVAIQVGDVILATVDSPGQTTGNWTKLNTNITYVPEDQANKETSALDTSTSKYPCNNVVKTAVDGKQNTMTKATGAEVDTGTDDAKFVTAKAIEDSSYMKNPMTTAGDVIYGGTSGVPTRFGIGTAGQVLKVNTGATGVEWGTGGGSTGGSYMFAIAGTIGATGTNVANTVLVNGTKIITSVDLWYGTAGSGTLTVDVNKNGTTIFATTKPSITTTNQGSVASGTLTTTSLASGDYLTIDIDAVPGTTLPVDLYVRVNYS